MKLPDFEGDELLLREYINRFPGWHDSGDVAAGLQISEARVMLAMVPLYYHGLIALRIGPGNLEALFASTEAIEQARP